MHQIRSVSLYSYLDVAAFVGIDGHRLLKEAGIAPSVLDLPTRVPAPAAVELLERSATLSKCDSFGIRMAACRTFPSLGPLSLLLERLNDVGAVIDTMSSLSRNLSDILMVACEVDGDVVLSTFDVIAPYSEPQTANLTVALGYIALTGASRGLWSPEAVHFTHGAPHDRVTFERFFHAPLVFDSSFNGFSFATAMLRHPLPFRDPEMAENARRLLERGDLPAMLAPMTDHAVHSIILLLPHGKATLADVAKNLSQSERALQRALAIEGKTFFELLNDVRRSLAQSYLLQTSQSLTWIASSLGYANQSSFTRWFEREFEAAPSLWRGTHRATLRLS